MWCPAPASSCSVCPEKPHPDPVPEQPLSVNRVASPWSLPGLRCSLSSFLVRGPQPCPPVWLVRVFSPHLYRDDLGTVSVGPSWTGQDYVCLEGGKQPIERWFSSG